MSGPTVATAATTAAATATNTAASTDTEARGSTVDATAPVGELDHVDLGPDEDRVDLAGLQVAGLTARYAERVDGTVRLVATGEGPWVDTHAVFTLDESGRPAGPVDVTAAVRVVGIPVARVDAPGLPWRPGVPLPGPTVTVRGQILDIAGPGEVRVRPTLPTQPVPGLTRVLLPPTLGDLASGHLLDSVVDLARQIIAGGPDAATPPPSAPAPAPPPALDEPPVTASVEPSATEESTGPATQTTAPTTDQPADGSAPAGSEVVTEGAPEPADAGAPEGEAPVELLMPPAPSEPGPAQQTRMAAAATGARRAAGAARALPDAGATTAAARGAVDEPQTEANARAASDLAAALGGAPAPSPEILKLCDSIYAAIRSKRPADEDELTKADIKGAAEAAGQTLDGSIRNDSDRVAGSYNSLQQTPTGTPSTGTPVTEPGTGVADPGIDAAAAAPDPIPPENLSLDADRDRIEARADESRIERHSTEPLAQTPPFSDVRQGRDELTELAATGPADVAAQQAAAIGQAQADMQALQAQALQSLRSARGGTVGGVGGGQRAMVTQETVTRESVSAEAQRIFTETQTQVQALLEPLARTAMARWDVELERLSTEFRNHLNRVQSWIDDRHSGASGFVVGLWDAVTGLPGWVTEEYDDAERRFGDGVCAVLLSIDADVASIIASARALIEDARSRTRQLFTDLPADLQEWAATEQAKFESQLDGLAKQTEQTRMGFVAEISQKAVTAVGDVQREVEELRQKAGGLIGRIAAAIEAFIDDPVRAIINGLLSLVGISPAAFWALVDKIGEVIGQIADDPETFGNNLVEVLRQGFQLFIDHFGQHLMGAFWQWLFSRCGSVGVTVPRDTSLRSIIGFVLSIMGITWPNIRKILVREVGERNVALIEKVWEFVSLLVREGPGGIMKLISDRLTPEAIIEAVLQAAVEMAVELLTEKVAVKLLSMLNPASAVVQAILLIYDLLKWIFHNAARIFTFVETIVDTCAKIIAGDLATVAVLIEKALASLLVVVIDLFMEIAGLGDLPEKVAKGIGALQEMVLSVVETVVVWLVKKGRALLASLGFGGKDDQKPGEGGDDGELGTTVRFRAGGESHRIWIQVAGTAVQLMMASTAEPVADKVREWRQQVAGLADDEPHKAEATTLLDQVEALVASTDAEATSVKQQQDQARQDNDPSTVPASDDAVESDERQLASLLVRLYQLLESDNLAASVQRVAAALPGLADRRAGELRDWWARNVAGIQVGPVDRRGPLVADPAAALGGLTGADGAGATGNTSTQEAVAGYFLTARGERSVDRGAFYQFAFVTRNPRPPHPLRPDFTTALGNAALGLLRTYVDGQLTPSTTALSDEEKAGIREMLAGATFVMSGDFGRFAGLRTREPDHAYFKPRRISVQSDGALAYETESGQSFQIEETKEGLPVRVVGQNLTQFIGRGVTQDSPYFVKNQGFNRAHVIANRFGGSGYRSGRNLVTTSAHYNQELMAGAEDMLAAHVDRQAGDADSRVRATMPPQAAAVSFTLSVQLAYVDAVLRLVADLVGRDPDIKDKDKKVHDEIVQKLRANNIDQRLQRVKETKYDLTDLKVAGETRDGLKTELGEDEWLLREGS